MNWVKRDGVWVIQLDETGKLSRIRFRQTGTFCDDKLKLQGRTCKNNASWTGDGCGRGEKGEAEVKWEGGEGVISARLVESANKLPASGTAKLS